MTRGQCTSCGTDRPTPDDQLERFHHSALLLHQLRRGLNLGRAQVSRKGAAPGLVHSPVDRLALFRLQNVLSEWSVSCGRATSREGQQPHAVGARPAHRAEQPLDQAVTAVVARVRERERGGHAEQAGGEGGRFREQEQRLRRAWGVGGQPRTDRAGAATPLGRSRARSVRRLSGNRSGSLQGLSFPRSRARGQKRAKQPTQIPARFRVPVSATRVPSFCE